MTIGLTERLALLHQQAKYKKPKQCLRCSLFYEESQETCPHCTGMSERQVEALIRKNNTTHISNFLYLILMFAALAIFFAALRWLF